MSISRRIDALAKRLFGDRAGFHWSIENDSFRAPVLRESSFPFHGRAWLNLGDRVSMQFEWVLAARSMHVTYKQDPSDNEHLIGVALPPVSLWAGLRSRAIRPKAEREWGLSVHDSALWWMVGANPFEWRSADPWYRNGSWHPARTFFGKWIYTAKPLREERISIPMPEGDYPATATLSYETRGYARSPFKHHQYAVKIDMDPGFGIPFPGKGENSWDCDDDATLGMSTPARTIQEAIGHMVASILRTRANRGAPARWPVFPPPTHPTDQSPPPDSVSP